MNKKQGGWSWKKFALIKLSQGMDDKTTWKIAPVKLEGKRRLLLVGTVKYLILPC